MNKFLSRLSIIFGIIYFIYETWYHISYNQSNLALTADYVGVFLLLIAGIVNLKSKQGIRLLCGAWGYTSCLMYRAFIRRIEAIWVDELPNYENLQVTVLILALLVSFAAFTVCFVKSFPKKTK